jgi:nitrite reductase/ring-hydroxylating ferredoxin subunit
VGYLIVAAAAYIGGDVVYALGNMVDHHAFRSRGSKWAALDAPAEIPEGVLTKATSGGQTLVLVRRGDTIHAMHETCAHAGGPLAKGTLVDGCVECPWHGSRFDLATGHLRRGPAVYDQPRYEVRRAEGGAGWEARRVLD